jgi:hypothetical protein
MFLHLESQRVNMGALSYGTLPAFQIVRHKGGYAV